MNRKAGATTYGDHPLVRWARSLPEELYLSREVAEQLECSAPYLVWLRNRTDGAQLGPTHKAAYGGTTIYLYTPQRIEEIAAFMDRISKREEGNQRRGPILLWTVTEKAQRRKDQDRASRNAKRAQEYREHGMDKQAAKAEKTSATILARLEKARIRRWERVHKQKWEPNA